MRTTLVLASIFLTGTLLAQPTVPDSTMKEISRLVCECATLMKIGEGDSKEGLKNLGTCVNSTVSVFHSNGWMPNVKMDSAWTLRFDAELQERVNLSCPAYRALLEKLTPVTPYLPTVDKRYFLSEAAMKARNMEVNESIQNIHMRKWTVRDFDKKDVQVVFDIRYVFNTEKEAAAYYKSNLKDFSEDGKPTPYNLKALGATESNVYGMNPRLGSMFGVMDMNQYNFIFRVKKVMAKVFVSGKKKMTYAQALVFAKEAIARVRAVK